MADPSDVILLEYFQTKSGARCEIALAEKGVEYEYRDDEATNKSSLLLQMNRVPEDTPVLVHKGKSISDSLTIVQYIDEAWPDKPPLLPSDPYDRAQARFWADYIDKKFEDLHRKMFSTQGEEQKVAAAGILESLKLLEGILGDKPFFGGENFGFLDIAFIPSYGFFGAYEVFGKFSIESECPTLIAWAKRCMEKKSVSCSLVDKEKVRAYKERFARKRNGSPATRQQTSCLP